MHACILYSCVSTDCSYYYYYYCYYYIYFFQTNRLSIPELAKQNKVMQEEVTSTVFIIILLLLCIFDWQNNPTPLVCVVNGTECYDGWVWVIYLFMYIGYNYIQWSIGRKWLSCYQRLLFFPTCVLAIGRNRFCRSWNISSGRKVSGSDDDLILSHAFQYCTRACIHTLHVHQCYLQFYMTNMNTINVLDLLFKI